MAEASDPAELYPPCSWYSAWWVQMALAKGQPRAALGGAQAGVLQRALCSLQSVWLHFSGLFPAALHESLRKNII